MIDNPILKVNLREKKDPRVEIKIKKRSKFYLDRLPELQNGPKFGLAPGSFSSGPLVIRCISPLGSIARIRVKRGLIDKSNKV